MYMIVAGGGKVGYNLTLTLLKNGHEVTLIEKDSQRCRWLEDHLGDIVVHGDATEVGTLEAAGAKRASILAAVTGSDEDNILICRLAQDIFGIRRVIGRVNYPQNEDTFRLLGINNLVNSTRLIYHLMLQEVNICGLVPLLTLKGGEFEFVDVRLAPGAPAAHVAIKNLILPERSLLLAVLREDELIFPRGDVVLQPGDHIIAITVTSEAEALRRALVGEVEE
ncbi:trk system potassium uptake protein TrkA [Thermanaeromonas toyohensis ToBE]|uniref:Trk system potassium uptake protein TrkA n=1 Tax=Thermanaeromonas toyohensis ToBE TaxID=698762 RepID=A0A1W1V9N7_9FIRM|nr:NAD-binding protein [Thermanaeromonas toyohensis]SMB90005.1 trk system potassium uptake protein TrkA [Thermanaeromonas toyohensis ToBE]